MVTGELGWVTGQLWLILPGRVARLWGNCGRAAGPASGVSASCMSGLCDLLQSLLPRPPVGCRWQTVYKGNCPVWAWMGNLYTDLETWVSHLISAGPTFQAWSPVQRRRWARCCSRMLGISIPDMASSSSEEETLPVPGSQEEVF